ncbi:MAG TPA: fibronectin type III domain-containing protein, partial [bacterium]|nr:fibronectin type III domain-containing protein [bacterium]
TSLVAVSGNTTISLSWTNPADTDFNNIAIFRSTAENFTPDLATNKIANTITSSEATYLDTTTENNTTYYYVIKALDDADNYSISSAEVSGKPDSDSPTTPGALTIPEKVSTLDAKEILNKKDITIAWAKSADENSGIKSYHLSIGTKSGGNDITDGKELLVSGMSDANLPSTIYSLPADGVYYVRIKAVDNLGNTSSYSAELVFVLDTTAPQVAGKASLFDISDRVTKQYAVLVLWSKAIDSGAGLSGYKVLRDGKTVSEINGLTSGVTSNGENVYYLDSLAPEILASYKIIAIDQAKNESVALPAMVADTQTTKAAGLQPGAEIIKLPATLIGEGKLEFGEITAKPSLVVGKKTQAKVDWKTSVPATSQVEYGEGVEYAFKTELDSGLNSSHTEILTELLPNTVYHFRVISKDKNGNEIKSEDQTFTTNQYSKQKSIFEVVVDSITNAFSGVWSAIRNMLSLGSANRALAAEDLALSVIDISTPEQPGYVIRWSSSRGKVALERKEAGGDFKPLVETENSVYADFEVKKDLVYSYRIGDVVAEARDEGSGKPEISEIKVEPGAVSQQEASAIVTFKTNILSKASVVFGESAVYGSKSENDPSLNQSHTVLIEKLKPDTSYHFKVSVLDKTGANIAESSDQTFVTASAPANESVFIIIVKALQNAFSGFDAWMRR